MALNSSVVSGGDDILATDHNELREDIQQHTHDGTDTTDLPTIIADKNAGETISANRPVFMHDTDNEWYFSDANDTARYRFDGFSLEAGTNGNAMRVQTIGVVDGFTSLDIGKKYYVQDDGTIGTTQGTQKILVGIAVSATEILITKDGLVASGTQALSSTTTYSITTGFKPKMIICHLVSTDGYHSQGSSDGITNHCVRSDTSAVIDASNAWNILLGSGENNHGVMDTFTDAGFRINNTHAGGAMTNYLHWIAIG